MRETGLEPARPKAYAPKAYVYTNFTTRAAPYKNGGVWEIRTPRLFHAMEALYQMS